MSDAYLAFAGLLVALVVTAAVASRRRHCCPACEFADGMEERR